MEDGLQVLCFFLERFTCDPISLFKNPCQEALRFGKRMIDPIPSMVHVCYMYLHVVEFFGECREIYHAWILWGFFLDDSGGFLSRTSTG